MTERIISKINARRLAITRQRLSGDPAPATPAGIMEVVRDLGCLQLDPISAVARSHTARPLEQARRLRPRRPGSAGLRGAAVVRILGARRLDCADRRLPDSPLADAPLRQPTASRLVEARARLGRAESGAARLHPRRADAKRARCSRARSNSTARSPSIGYPAAGRAGATSAGCSISSGRSGEIMVAGRAGRAEKLGFERALPARLDAARPAGTTNEVVAGRRRSRCGRSASPPRSRSRSHYTRGRYPNLPRRPESARKMRGASSASSVEDMPGAWYIHADDLPLLDRIEAGDVAAAHDAALAVRQPDLRPRRAPKRCGISTSASKFTSRRPSGSTATTSCPFCTATA